MREFAVLRRGVELAAGLSVVAVLSGCSGSSGFEAPSNGGTTLGNLLAFNSVNAPSKVKPVDMEEKPTCPEIEVLDGTSSNRAYGAGEQSNANVRYQFSMGDVVRECSRVGDQLIMKVGIEGRALLGPVGTPGGFTAPVRIAIRAEKDDKPVTSKLYQIPVTIGAGDTSAPFSIVSDAIAVPYLTAQANTDYTIVVGFDAKGDGGGVTKTKTRRKNVARRP